ncbi:MAG: NAD kinase [Bacteroidia bacterium]
MRVAIYGRNQVRNLEAIAKEVVLNLEKAGAGYIMYSPFKDFLCKTLKTKIDCPTFKHHSEIKGEVDFLISIGGDGTLLDTISLVRDSKIPIIGINAGRMGFLASIPTEEIEYAIDCLAKGRYDLDHRTLLRLESNQGIFGELNFALNELTIHKKETASMITIHTYLNGEYLNSYWADGLIIATPTGSTGYSLSCNGPIIFPQSENFVITPIAPHNLNVRPIIVSDKNVISLEVEGRSKNFMASLDSRSFTIDSSVQMAVRKENFYISLIRLHDQNFLSTLRQKLMWGLDSRN